MSQNVTEGLLQQGNEEAWEKLIKEHRSQLIKFARSIIRDESEAEDVAQTVLMRLWEQRDRFSTIRQFKSYVNRSIHNESLNLIRHRKRIACSASFDMAMQSTATSPREQPIAIAQRNELTDWLDRAQQTLSQRQREVFAIIRKDPDQSSRRIAATLGCSHKNVLAILMRIRRAFAQHVKTESPKLFDRYATCSALRIFVFSEVL